MHVTMSRGVHAHSILLMLAAAGTGTAQTDWHLLSSGTASRTGQAMAFDSATGTSMVFGGTATGSASSLTEFWDGRQWTTANPPNAPPARSYAAMASDIVRRRVVLFGGLDAAGRPLADTWEWNGFTWLQATPGNSPRARVRTAMAYDVVRLHTVLFGGDAFPSVLGDTWEWNGLLWSPRPTVVAPPARTGHAMAFDLPRGRTVLFGGVGLA